MTAVTQQDVQAFCDCCVAMRSLWEHRSALFEGPASRRDLLRQVAPGFFRDLDHLLIEHLILQICKITDPEESSRGEQNLTLEFLVNHADFTEAPETIVTLRQLRAQMQAFREKIVPARNKLIGHLDRTSVLRPGTVGQGMGGAGMGGAALGGASGADWRHFWLNLQDFLHILHKRFIDPAGGFHLNDIAGPSDAEGLVTALRESRQGPAGSVS